MKRKPLTKIRSEWHEVDVRQAVAAGMLEADARGWQRNVSDGHLQVFTGTMPDGTCHLSISHRTNHNPPQPGRYPRWDEIADARDRFCPPDATMAMLVPPAGEYVALHDTTFHLHQVVGAEVA